MRYEELLKEAEEEGMELFENDCIGGLKGLCVNNIITLNTNIETKTEKKCVLAEEIGHFFTTSGNILDQSTVQNRKQELKARAYAYDKLIGITGLINAYKHGAKSRYEISEYLNVSEQFLEEAVTYYSKKYGLFYEIDNYVLYFSPLGVLEKFKEE